jgi:2-polyprenyl-6-hydroxyphenyl methylase/3-demethylubiquinone-9 3-methyltransferase
MIKQAYYERYWSTEGFLPHGYMKPELERLYSRHIPSGSSCLDVGCGEGQTSGPWLLHNRCQYVGVDVSENAVNLARASGLEARHIDGAYNLTFPDGSFDVVVCVEVLEHLFEPEAATAEMLRVLRPGGKLIATVPNFAYWRRRLEVLSGRWNPLGDGLSVAQPWRDPHIRFFTAAALGRMMHSVGFTEVVVGGHAGAIVRDLPWIGHRLSQSAGGAVYRTFEALFPSLLGYGLHPIGRKRETRDAQPD